MTIFRPLPRVASGVVLPGRVVQARRILQGVSAGLPAFTALRFSRLGRNFTLTEVVRLFRATANLLEAGFFADSLPARSRQFLKNIPIVSDLGARGAERITYAVQLTFELGDDIVEERLVYVLTDAPLSSVEAKQQAFDALQTEIRKARRKGEFACEPLELSDVTGAQIIFVGRRF